MVLTLMLLLDDSAVLCWLVLPGSLTADEPPSAETVCLGVRATPLLKALLGPALETP